MSDVVAGFTALQDAAPGYVEAHSYYDGSVSEVFGSRTLKRMLRRQGKPFKINVIQSVVDSVADRLELLSLTVEGESGDGTSGGVAQQRLAAILKANAIDFESSNVHHRACEYGDAYLLVWDGAEEGDEPVMNYHSPMSARIVYDPDNPRVKRFAVQAWEEKTPLGDKTKWRVNLWYADRIERWQTQPGTKPEEATSWEEAPSDDDDPDSWTAENPYGEVPWFHFRNATPYGVPRHYNGYGAQDAVNKLVISHMSTIDFHVFPQRYALTEADGGDDEFDLDDDDEFDTDGEAKVPGDDAGHGIKSGPGEVWWLKNVKRVGQFDPAKSEAFTGPLNMYLRLMAQTTKTPLHMVDESGDEPSGESRRRKEGPLTKAIRDYSKMFGSVWADAAAFALKVAGLDGRTVKATFAPAEVVADLEGWQTIKAKIESGVPVRQALREAGYTEKEVDEWFPDGEENTLRVADLVSVADILQRLGAAVALDIITAEEARALLPEGILPDAPAPPQDGPPAVPGAPAGPPEA